MKQIYKQFQVVCLSIKEFMIVITSSKYLYMGNKMLQYAIFIAFSEETGVRIVNPSFAPYSHHFKNLDNDFFMRYPVRKSRFRGGRKLRNAFYFVSFQLGKFFSKKGVSNSLVDAVNLEWDKTIEISSVDYIKRAKKSKYFFSMGWGFQHKFNLEKHRERIKKYFEPLDSYQVNIKQFIAEQRKEADLLIGVHIRHGDYKTFEGGKYFYETPLYVNLMKRCETIFSDRKIKFVVCSNERQDSSFFEGLNFSFGTNHPVEDMYSLAECDYIIGAPSTFTIWASYYGNTPIYMIEDINKEILFSDFNVRNNF